LSNAQSDLSSNVSRGENAGRMLNHRTVVRQPGLIGSAEAKHGASFSAESTVTLAKGWKLENLRAVAFLQERMSRRVIGAGAVKLTGEATPGTRVWATGSRLWCVQRTVALEGLGVIRRLNAYLTTEK